MNTLDLFLLAFIAIGFFVGLFRGFVREAIGIVGIFVAAFVANLAAPYTVPTFGRWIGNLPAAAVIIWIVVFILTMFALKRLAIVLERILRAAMLGWVNRLAGGLLGAMSAVLLAALLLAVVAMFGDQVADLPIAQEMKTSRIVPYLHRIVDLVMPWCTDHLIRPALTLFRE